MNLWKVGWQDGNVTNQRLYSHDTNQLFHNALYCEHFLDVGDLPETIVDLEDPHAEASIQQFARMILPSGVMKIFVLRLERVGIKWTRYMFREK